MSKTINAYLFKIGPDFKSEKGALAGDIKRLFIFRELDTEKEFRANIPLQDNEVASRFLPNGQVGNVFFGLQTQDQHPKNIDVYKPFTRVEIKEKNRGSI